MVDVDDVIAGADTTQTKNHLRRDHRRSDLHQGLRPEYPGVLRKDNIFGLPIVRGTEHIRSKASLSESLGENLHHLLHSTTYRVELTKL